MEKTKDFISLIVWQKTHQLALAVYNITKSFPKEEVYSLTDQTRRCAVSITSNIAEGFSRHGQNEKVQFYYMALGSATEMHNQLIFAKDFGYLMNADFTELEIGINDTGKLLNGLIRSIKSPSY